MLRIGAQWRAFLRSAGSVDVVDCPPFLAAGRGTLPGRAWLCRSTQPDVLYTLDTLRDGRWGSFADARRYLAFAGMAGVIAGTIYRGWLSADIVMCHTSSECRRIARWSPWLRAKLTNFDGALSDEDQTALDHVRKARRQRPEDAPIRYVWIGRWIGHKGPDRLLSLVKERLASSRDEFTVLGCGRGRARCPGDAGRRPAPAGDPPRSRAQTSPRSSPSRTQACSRVARRGWGLALNEMLEAGLPVYATEAGGVEDLRSVLPASVAPRSHRRPAGRCPLRRPKKHSPGTAPASAGARWRHAISSRCGASTRRTYDGAPRHALICPTLRDIRARDGRTRAAAPGDAPDSPAPPHPVPDVRSPPPGRAVDRAGRGQFCDQTCVDDMARSPAGGRRRAMVRAAGRAPRQHRARRGLERDRPRKARGRG